jgi:hypothetical protein
MPQRFITDVSPASYEMERVTGSATPSMLNDLTTPPTIMRSITEMAPSIGNIIEPEIAPAAEETFIEDEPRDEAPWMRAIRELYGSQEDKTMPLAIPYGAFALPREEGPALPAWMQEALGDTGAPSRSAAASYTPISMPTPSIPLAGYSQSGSSYISSSTPAYSSGSSWGDSTVSTGSYDDGSSAETDAWAGVIADAVSDVGATSPALALAGEEGGGGGESQSSNQNQQAEEGDKPGGGADVDELAESVYAILRRRLTIERERNFA